MLGWSCCALLVVSVSRYLPQRMSLVCTYGYWQPKATGAAAMYSCMILKKHLLYLAELGKPFR